jgi:hypothetical protein
MTHAQYIQYFEDIAVEHYLIQHNPDAGLKAFFRIDIDELLEGLPGKKISFPCMLLESFTGEYEAQDNFFDNPYDKKTCAFTILYKTKQNDYDDQNEKLDKALQIGHDIIARILHDMKKKVLWPDGTQKITLFYPASTVYQKVGPIADNEYGYRFQFELQFWNHINLRYDPDKFPVEADDILTNTDEPPDEDTGGGGGGGDDGGGDNDPSARMSIDTTVISEPILNIPGVDDVSINSDRHVADDSPASVQWRGYRNDEALETIEAPDAGSMMAWTHVGPHVRAATATHEVNLVHSGVQSVDGITTETGDRIFDKDNVNPVLRGIWDANDDGAWSRSFDFDETSDICKGLHIKAWPQTNNGTAKAGGVENSGKTFVIATSNPITIGTTGLTFTEYDTPYSDGYDYDNNEFLALQDELPYNDITEVNSGEYTGVINNSCVGYTYWDEVLDYVPLLKSTVSIVANMISPMIPYKNSPRPLDFDDVDIDRVFAEICYKLSTLRKKNLKCRVIQLGFENKVSKAYVDGWDSDYMNLVIKLRDMLIAYYGDALPPLSGDTGSADALSQVNVDWRTANAGLNTILQRFRQYFQLKAGTQAQGFQFYLDRLDQWENFLDLYQSQDISTGLPMELDQFVIEPPDDPDDAYNITGLGGEAVMIMKLFYRMIKSNLERNNLILSARMAPSHLVGGIHNHVHPLHWYFTLGRNTMFRSYAKVGCTITGIPDADNWDVMATTVQDNFTHLELLSDFGRNHIINQGANFYTVLGTPLVLESDYQTNGTAQIILDQLAHSDAYLRRAALADQINNPNFFVARTTEWDGFIFVDPINVTGLEDAPGYAAAIAQVNTWMHNLAVQFIPTGGYGMHEEIGVEPNAQQKFAWKSNEKAVEVIVINETGDEGVIPVTDVDGNDVEFNVESYFLDDPLDADAQHYTASSTGSATIKPYCLTKITITNINF